ncbi:MAG: carbamoyl-phosphate synthase large subunit [Lachnospiraceae bacterium]|nr:carbamoyl-phosphate synthase large subunit [Lachnospiraceae bacterium]
MPKRTDIRKILVIGSGPIVIGQAAEFDYAGTQACLALREEGYEVILCNSNPATIMTDKAIADKVYMEPLTLEFIAKVIRKERPDAILPGIGGQTGLNLAMQLKRKGVLDECQVRLLGTDSDSIDRAEDRERFKELCESIGEPVLPSEIVEDMEAGLKAAEDIGYPIVVRPAFTLGGTGGGFADDEEELKTVLKNALSLSPIHQALIEKSVKGYKEIEYEVMRDANDTAITICNMENLDPVGIHTGDSIVVCPSQTLTNREYHMLRDAALNLIRALKVEGGCNVQFALDPNSFDYYVIEVNPRVSRSSALASKASGYPIARVSAKISVGLRLDEIMLANTPACFEPSLDYVVSKMPRFPFDKFTDASNLLGTQMKATGEVMSVGRSFPESLLKAVRSLEIGVYHLYMEKFDHEDTETLKAYISEQRDDRVYAIAELLRRGVSKEEISSLSGIDMFFIDGLSDIINVEKLLAKNKDDIRVMNDKETLYLAKRMGFCDKAIGKFLDMTPDEVRALRKQADIKPLYKMIDSCASEFDSYIPYFYSTYETESYGEDESIVTNDKKVVVLGSGPIRIGQGVEFDYSTVHAVMTIRAMGYEAIIINNNPETVSTDYTMADKLYFEPLTVEDVMNIIDKESPEGVIVTLGGQTAVNLAIPLAERGVPIIGTDAEAIDRAEDRDLFEKLLQDLGIPQPKGEAVTSVEAGIEVAERIGYPVLVRPSFVLGGRAMQIVAKRGDMEHYLHTAVEVDEDKPVLVDKYIKGKEVEIDGICDGRDVFVPGIMELVERTGVHSGDSMSMYPADSISDNVKRTILEYSGKLGIGIGIKGLFNIQFIVDDDDNVYIIEVNPRSSRTVPFLSKATGYGMADIATKVMLGNTLSDEISFADTDERLKEGITMDIDAADNSLHRVFYPGETKRRYVKAPAFSFSKLMGMDAYLSPEMKSTGEAIGYDNTLHRAMYKALIASGVKLSNYGTVMVTLADEDKEEALPLVKRFYALGFNIEATIGTADYLKEHGIKTRVRHKLSEGSDEILRSIKAGYVSYVINTRAILSGVHYEDGVAIRRCATQNNVTMFTSLDTVRVLLDVLEEVTVSVDEL